MSRKRITENIVKFAEDKGFYIILGLCVLAIGVSGYVLFFTGAEPVTEPDTSLFDTEFMPGEDYWRASGGKEESEKDMTPTEITPQGKNHQPEPLPDEPAKPSGGEAEPEGEAPPEAIEVSNPVKVEQTQYVRPVKGEVLRGYSGDELTFDETMGDWRTHRGTDLACEDGEEVLVIADGRVTGVYTDGMLGNCVAVTHGDQLVSTYCGLAVNSTMKVGMELKAGDAVGKAGNTVLAESAQAPHIHVEVTCAGEYIDPMGLFE
ncbi:MAG: M23 family metallopeptidase [Clostridia bacterium]|nr:M23 family metallopeptidase [Clostridia bacterium]